MDFSPNILPTEAEQWQLSGASFDEHNKIIMQQDSQATTVIGAVSGQNQTPSYFELTVVAAPFSDRYTPNIIVQIEVTYEDASTITLSTPVLSELSTGVVLPIQPEITENVLPFSSIRFSISSAIPTIISSVSLCASLNNVVIEDKNYYGVKLSSAEGIKIVRTDGRGEVIMNADTFAMRSKVGNTMVDKVYFDPASGDYNFAGDVNVTSGSINIGGNFIVDRNGNVIMAGSATLSGAANIYSGKFFAGDILSGSGYSQMTTNGFEIYDSIGRRILLGYTDNNIDYPFLLLGQGDGTENSVGLVKKFANGMWVGNAAPKNHNGFFEAKNGYNGLFFNFNENQAYVVHDRTMKNIFTGDAVAKFG